MRLTSSTCHFRNDRYQSSKKGGKIIFTHRLRVREPVGEAQEEQNIESMNFCIGEVTPLFYEGLFFGSYTQQCRGIWTTAGDNWTGVRCQQFTKMIGKVQCQNL